MAHLTESPDLNKSVSTKVQFGYTLAWQNLSYTVKLKSLTGKYLGDKQILKGISGRVAPGQVIGIMGPSGCGKTTLLNILADRVSSGNIDGSILVNGAPRDPETFRHIACYVAQEDALLGSFTVLETLRHAAVISLPTSLSKAERETRIQNAIDDMGLRSCENTLVGDIFHKGLSGGQKRRLSIAIELVAKPSILILDEPTSGLDSSATQNIMSYIVSLAKGGHTVLCTIHQPSAGVFNMFDKLVLMVEGRVASFSSPTETMKHFAKLGFECPMYTNPSDYYLELINTDFESHGDVDKIVEGYASSVWYKEVNEEINKDTSLGGVLRTQALLHKPSSVRQFFVLMKRNTMNNIRNPGIYWVRLAMYFMLSAMVGTMYIRFYDNIKDQDILVLLFYVQAFLVFMSVAVLPFFIEQREVFVRERANSQLSVISFSLAGFLSALPGLFMIALLSTLLVVLLAGLNSFGWFLLNLFLSLVVAESLMRLIGAAVSHYIIGIAVGAGIYGMFMLVSGFMVPRESIPPYWIWAHYIAFHKYSLESFVYEQFRDGGKGSGMYIIHRLNMEDVDVGRDMGILTAWALLYEILFVLILYKYHTGRK